MDATNCALTPRWLGDRAPGAPAPCAFFLISAASAGWVDAAAAYPRIHAVDVSIEALGVFAAIDASKATGRLQLVIAGSGPGTLGMLWVIPGAKAQGASLLVLTPRTAAQLAGAVDIQESSYRNPLHMAGAALFDEVIPTERRKEMSRIAMWLRHLFARPQGAVVLLSAPTDLLKSACPPLPDIPAVEVALPAPSARTMARIADLLTWPGGPPAFVLSPGCEPYAAPSVPCWSAGTRFISRPLRRRRSRPDCWASSVTLPMATYRASCASSTFAAWSSSDRASARPRAAPTRTSSPSTVTSSNSRSIRTLPRQAPVCTWNGPVLSVPSDTGDFLGALQRVDTTARDPSHIPRSRSDCHMSNRVHPEAVADAVVRAAAGRAQEVAIFAESSMSMFYGTRAMCNRRDAPAPTTGYPCTTARWATRSGAAWRRVSGRSCSPAIAAGTR